MVVDVLCRASTQGGAESQMNTATTLTTDHDRTIIAHKSEAVALQGNIIAGIAGDGYRWHERMVAAKSAGGGYDHAYTMKIRSGCEGGGKGPLVQNDLSATLATHQDQTVFAPKAEGFLYKAGAKAGSVGAGKVAPTLKTDCAPGVAYANGGETTARTLTARFDGSPMLDRGPNLIVQKENGNEKDYCD